jgi:hypothetical protein
MANLGLCARVSGVAYDCRKCGEPALWPDGFVKSTSSASGRLAHCKCCQGRQQKSYLSTHPESKTKGNSATRAWALRKENWARYTCTQIRHRCKRRKIPFELVPEDLVFPERCPLLGVPLVRRVRGEGKPFDGMCASVDRIDSKLGYVRGNVWVISNRANIIKHNASLEELEMLTMNLRRFLESRAA